MPLELPFLKPVESVSEILDLVGSESKMGQRLKALEDIKAYLSKILERYQDIQDAQGYLTTARATQQAAVEVKKQADDYFADKRKEHEKIMSDLTRKIDEFNSNTRAQNEAAANRARELNQRETAIITRENALNKFDADTQKKAAEAAALLKNALEIKADYEARMQKIREVAA